ncbi:MAG: NADH-quinone oxidoreductase subunit L, partial [Candidatus Thorarchaeota archaeon]
MLTEWLSGNIIAFLVPLIPLLPYLAVFAIVFAGLIRKSYRYNAWIGVFANLISWIISMIVLLYSVFQYIGNTSAGFPEMEIHVLDWFGGQSFGWTVQIGFLVDGLSVIMISLVSTLSLLIQIYGVAYMEGEEGLKSGRYNAEINLFVGSMLLLSLSGNFLLFFIGWELMGVCSYLLIGFFTKKEETNAKGQIINKPASAAKKAFMITKLGDILLMAGFMLFFWEMLKNGVADPLNFASTRSAMAANGGIISNNIQTLIALLLLGGAVGKSAQFPLHIWLPDAMEGPTTVSALIHSATMVKAGVFLVARTYYIFEGTDALLIVAIIGGFTAIFAATMAFTANDIKRVLAYSTISQLGYMFLGLGVYSLTAGMFHLISHSIFKCLLFLGAGSIIHAVHSNDMRDMGGLKKYMKWTRYTFLAGGIGLSGIIPANGFFSKDAVIGSAFAKWIGSGDMAYFIVASFGLITALLTGFYFFRMYYQVFEGEYRGKAKVVEEEPKHEEEVHHAEPHEAPILMRMPLIVLGSLVFITGFLSLDGLLQNVIGFSFTEALGSLGHLNVLNEHVLSDILHHWLLFPEAATEIDVHSWVNWLFII